MRGYWLRVVRRWAKARRASRPNDVNLGVGSAAWAGGPRADTLNGSHPGPVLVRQQRSTLIFGYVYYRERWVGETE